MLDAFFLLLFVICHFEINAKHMEFDALYPQFKFM